MAEMEIDTHDDILRKAALNGSMDYSSWPGLLPDVLERIEKIAHTVFPIPHVPPPSARPMPPLFAGPPSSVTAIPDSSQETNKENASPTAARNTGNPAASSSTAVASATPGDPPAPGALPKAVQDMLDEILSVLSTNFTENPPHTIQRLSELVLQPRRHYKSVIAWLHALERVVHVTSGANIYPLPPAIPDMSTISLTAPGAPGTSHSTATSTVGTDEALGGALLTPIPWLVRRANGGPGSDSGSDAGSSSPLSASGITSGPSSGPSQHAHLQQRQLQQGQSRQLDGRVRTESTETIEGPNGMGRIETVSISVNGIPSTGAGGVGAVLAQRGITQGELLRQEQRAGVVPMSQLARQQQEAQARAQAHAAGESSEAAGEDSAMTSDPEDDETPHARGPDEIGAADTGPQPAGAATTYTIGTAGGGSVESRGIDVEAAVGRPPDQTDAVSAAIAAAARSGSPESEIIPRSPKRDAPDELPGSATKKLKDGGPRLDAEGDTVLPDSSPAAPEEQPSAEEAASAEKDETDASPAAQQGEEKPGGKEANEAASSKEDDKKEDRKKAGDS